MIKILKCSFIIMAISISVLLGSCGSEGSSDSAFDSPIGDGLLFAGSWTLIAEQRTGAETSLILNEDGTFINEIDGKNYGGFWSSSDGISIILRYSVTRENPPTGTMMSGTASDDRLSITGGYDYIPGFISLSRNDVWSATKK